MFRRNVVVKVDSPVAGEQHDRKDWFVDLSMGMYLLRFEWSLPASTKVDRKLRTKTATSNRVWVAIGDHQIRKERERKRRAV